MKSGRWLICDSNVTYNLQSRIQKTTRFNERNSEDVRIMSHEFKPTRFIYVNAYTCNTNSYLLINNDEARIYSFMY
jgi:hypothetical protein